jgi:hypothetical protein
MDEYCYRMRIEHGKQDRCVRRMGSRRGRELSHAMAELDATGIAGRAAPATAAAARLT